MEAENTIQLDARGWGLWEMESYFMGIKFQLCQINEVQILQFVYGQQYDIIHFKICWEGKSHINCSYPKANKQEAKDTEDSGRCWINLLS